MRHRAGGCPETVAKVREAERVEESQPIVSEFVYDDSALSKEFLCLASVSFMRKKKN